MRPNEIKTAEEAFQFLGVSEEEVIKYFLQVEEVMHHIISQTGIYEDHAKKYWVSGVNPFYSQLTPKEGEGLGLALVEYYGGPSKLSTPFGSISFSGLGAKDPEWFFEVRDSLGLKPLWGDCLQPNKPESGLFERDAVTYAYEDDIGCFGPVWEITKLQEKYTFPKCEFMPSYIGIPDMRTHICFPHDVVKDIWERCQPETFRIARKEADIAFANRFNHTDIEPEASLSPGF